jgi:membrane protein required for beta-lactamase induction
MMASGLLHHFHRRMQAVDLLVPLGLLVVLLSALRVLLAVLDRLRHRWLLLWVWVGLTVLGLGRVARHYCLPHTHVAHVLLRHLGHGWVDQLG